VINSLASSEDAAPRHVERSLALTQQQEQRFHALYSDQFDFVLRNLKRLGVPPAGLDDAVQEVYLVVLRRLRDLQHDAHLKAWLFAIIIRVAGNQRRSLRRRGTPEQLGERSIASTQPGPFDLTARAQAARFLHDFLNRLDDNRRAVFVMAELEQLTAPEIAEALGANLNTVYSWLRAARIAFSNTLQSMQAANGEEHG
jgi:RNA polymerase sigma-70 factor (ECF subfamily)